jgi:hypothetical protein
METYSAPFADCLRVLFLPTRVLAFRLTNLYGPWITSLPEDFEVVGYRRDPARKGLLLIIRSESFHRIAKGTAMPVYHPRCEGQKWMRWAE